MEHTNLGDQVGQILQYPEVLEGDALLVDVIMVGRVYRPSTDTMHAVVLQSPHTDDIVSAGLHVMFNSDLQPVEVLDSGTEDEDAEEGRD